MCFMYASIAANHYKHISNDPQRISKLTPYVKYYHWTGINFPAGPSEYNAFKKTIKNIQYMCYMHPMMKKI